MRTTLALDDELFAKAQAFTGLSEKSAVVREALRALVERESARRLARMGGAAPDFQAAPLAAAMGEMILADSSVWIGAQSRHGSCFRRPAE